MVTSASTCNNTPSSLLSTETWVPRLQVLRRLDRLRLCLFFMTASRVGRGLCCYKLMVVEPTPARRCLSWSLAHTSSYRSKTRIFSAGPHIASRAFSDSTVPPHGQIMWYINCWASTITTSGSWSWACLTPSLSTSGALFPLRRQPYSSTSDGGTAHSSYSNIGMSSISRCWPTIKSRRNIDSRSKTTLSPILTPFFRCSMVFTGDVSFA